MLLFAVGCRQLIIPDEKNAFPMARLVCGSLSGCTATIATYPLDVARARIAYQVTHRTHTGVWNSLSQTFQAEGVRGLFKGLGPSVRRRFTAACVWSGTRPLIACWCRLGVCCLSADGCDALQRSVILLIRYAQDLFVGSVNTALPLCSRFGGDALHPLLPRSHALVSVSLQTSYRPYVADEKGQLLIPYKMLCGGTSAVIAQTIAYPLDVIRRRMQLSGFSKEVTLTPSAATQLEVKPALMRCGFCTLQGPDHKYRHTWHALTSSIRQSGFRSLFVGLSINYIKHPPAMV